MSAKPTKPAKVSSDYPASTFGSRAAAKARQISDTLTREQRREHLHRGKAQICGGEL
jgi:hypothetical protein